MQWYKILSLCILASLCCVPALANVTAASIFGDNMVLQRDQPLPIWGTATPGERVTVSFDRQTAQVTTDVDGKWRVKLAAMPASTSPETLSITGKNTVAFANVLVGEMWVCSGQSNMAFAVADAKNARQEIAAADFPQIRMFTVTRHAAPVPCDGCEGAWVVCGPHSVASFSAVGYFYARELYTALHVPIGMINASYGGTPAESWTSLPGLKALPLFQPRAVAFEQAVQAYQADKGTAPGSSAYDPSALFNGMIAPLIPYAIRGAIWYQGESNMDAPFAYRQLFPGLITSWRQAWGEGDFPFAFVQLPNMNPVQQRPIENGSWAELREAQLRALALPNTGIAVTIDLGEAANLHPPNKQDVGKRLALAMLAKVYGKNLEYSGPLFSNMRVDKGQAILTFTHAGGLMAADSVNARGGILRGFAIAGADKVFHAARARIDGDTVIVDSANVPQPVAVRYAWAFNPVCNLYNAAGLPASPFRTDDWEPGDVKAADEKITV